MTVQVLTVAQGSEEWRLARLGIPTASEFKALLAKGEGKTRASYMRRLAGEIITGVPAEMYENADMQRGHEMEPEIISTYAFSRDVEPERVGFVRNGDKGCSPDALIGDKGVLEVKSKKPAVLIECILKDEFPADHVAQCQGALWVAEREWIDLVAYWPGMPLFVKRAHRDEAYIDKLAKEVASFNQELAEMVAKVHQYGVSA
jgi:hypothetical protein